MVLLKEYNTQQDGQISSLDHHIRLVRTGIPWTML